MNSLKKSWMSTGWWGWGCDLSACRIIIIILKTTLKRQYHQKTMSLYDFSKWQPHFINLVYWLSGTCLDTHYVHTPISNAQVSVSVKPSAFRHVTLLQCFRRATASVRGEPIPCAPAVWGSLFCIGVMSRESIAMSVRWYEGYGHAHTICFM